MGQDISRVDFLTFNECYFHDLAINPAVNRDRIEGLNSAQTVEKHRNIFLFYHAWHHWDRKVFHSAGTWSCCCRAGAILPPGGEPNHSTQEKYGEE